METNKLIPVLFCIVAGMTAVRAAEIEQPMNFQEGMGFKVWNSPYPMGPNPDAGAYTSYLIKGKQTVDGVEALEFHRLNNEGNVAWLDGLIRTEGSKAYVWNEETWKLLYDFGLQPGETMIGYGTFFQKLEYKCLSVEESPVYGGWKVMTLAMRSRSDEENEEPEEWNDHLPQINWIIGIGSEEGPLTPAVYGMVGTGGTSLESFTWDGQTLFVLPTAGINVTPARDLLPAEIYDMSGRVLPASPDALPSGFYIMRSGSVTKKVAIP